MEEYMINYKKESLDEILAKLHKLEFKETGRIELDDSYVVSIAYIGKENPEDILKQNKIPYDKIDESYKL